MEVLASYSKNVTDKYKVHVQITIAVTMSYNSHVYNPCRREKNFKRLLMLKRK